MASDVGSISYVSFSITFGITSSLSSFLVSSTLSSIPTSSKGTCIIYGWLVWSTMSIVFTTSYAWYVLNTTDKLLFVRTFLKFPWTSSLLPSTTIFSIATVSSVVRFSNTKILSTRTFLAVPFEFGTITLIFWALFYRSSTTLLLLSTYRFICSRFTAWWLPATSLS